MASKTIIICFPSDFSRLIPSPVTDHFDAHKMALLVLFLWLGLGTYSVCLFWNRHRRTSGLFGTGSNRLSPGLLPSCNQTDHISLPPPLLFLMSTTPLYYATHPFTTFQKCLLQPPQISIIITTLMLAD